MWITRPTHHARFLPKRAHYTRGITTHSHSLHIIKYRLRYYRASQSIRRRCVWFSFHFFFFVPDFFLPRLSKYYSDYLGNFKSARVVLENTRIYETFYSPNFIVFCFDCSLRESIFSSIWNRGTEYGLCQDDQILKLH